MASLIHSTITPERHDSIVRFAAATLLSLSISSVVVRLVWIRHPLRSLFGADDLATIIGMIVASVQSGCLLLALQYGFAQRSSVQDSENAEAVRKIIFAGDILYIIALCSSRIASTLLCRRLTRSDTREQVTFSVLTAIVTGLGVASVLAIAIQPPYRQPWESLLQHTNGCFVRWASVESVGMLFELVQFTCVSALVWQLQMTVEKKLAVTVAFATRLPVIAFAIVRLRSLDHARSLTDFNFEYTTPQIWGQIELHYSLMAATIPTLHIFLKNLTTGWLADLKDHPETAMASKVSGSRSGGLSLVHSNKSMSRSREHGNAVELQDWTDRRAQTRSLVHKGFKSDDAASDGSERHILVRQTVDVSHTVGH